MAGGGVSDYEAEVGGAAWGFGSGGEVGEEGRGAKVGGGFGGGGHGVERVCENLVLCREADDEDLDLGDVFAGLKGLRSSVDAQVAVGAVGLVGVVSMRGLPVSIVPLEAGGADVDEVGIACAGCGVGRIGWTAG